jgi:hypothetical protein
MMIGFEELISISKWSKADLYNALVGRSWQSALLFRKELQKSLAKYSANHEYDNVQDGILRILSQIEKWWRGGYVRTRVVELLKNDWSLVKSDSTKAKRLAHKEAQRILIRSGY